MEDQCLVSSGAFFGQPYSWISCSWSMPWGRAAGSGSVQSWLLPSPGSNSWEVWALSWKEGKGSCRGACRALPELPKAHRPVLWVGQSMVLSISPVINTQVVLCGWFLCVCVFFLESVFLRKWDSVIHWSWGFMLTEYVNTLGVFCMFQKAELLTAFVIGLLLDWYVLYYCDGQNWIILLGVFLCAFWA